MKYKDWKERDRIFYLKRCYLYKKQKNYQSVKTKKIKQKRLDLKSTIKISGIHQ